MEDRSEDRGRGRAGAGGLDPALSERLPPSRALGDVDQRWVRYHVAEKNTFLDVEAPLEETVGGMKLKFEQTSDPLPHSSSVSGSASSRGSSASRSQASLEVLDNILFGQDHVLFGSQSSSRSVDNEELGSVGTPRPRGGADTPGGADTGPGGAKRWCQAKRRRHHVLVERLKEAISNDPEGFDFETIDLPCFLKDNPKAKSKLLSLLQEHRDGELQKQRAGASATPAAPSSSAAEVSDTRPKIRIPAPKKMSL